MGESSQVTIIAFDCVNCQWKLKHMENEMLNVKMLTWHWQSMIYLNVQLRAQKNEVRNFS